MAEIRQSRFFKGGMAILFIALFLFSYANATLFWHCHVISGYKIYHSHICSAAHRSAPAEAAHTASELQLIQAVDQATTTETVVPACDLEPVWLPVETIRTEPRPCAGTLLDGTTVLRGPPALA